MQKVILRKKSIEDFSVKDHDPLDSSLQSSWLDESDIPEEPRYKNVWRYFVTKNGKDLPTEYKDREEAVKVARLYGKGFHVRSFEPSLDEVLASDRLRRKIANYNCCY